VHLSDSGISPGSGVNTRHTAIDKDSLGVKVISIGVPTVVGAAALAASAIRLSRPNDPLTEAEFENHCRELAAALKPFDENLLVTPNNIDALITEAAKIVAFGINQALHPNLSEQDIASLMP
jgi:spore protease